MVCAIVVELSSELSAGFASVSNFCFFVGVDESTRPPQRFERFDVGVGVRFGAEVVVSIDLGKYARSRTRSAKQLVSVVRPTILAVTPI